MPKPQKHVFVCAQGRPAGHPRGSCQDKHCTPVLEAFFQYLQQHNLSSQIQVTSSGCLGPCDFGPTVLVYPEGVMYAKVTAEDVNEIFEQHLLGNQPITRLLMPADIWG